LRIIGGKFKGRLIKPPAGLPARPTTDFAKEALFNVLSNRIDFEESNVLDLFSGTGNISFEFASRGAKQIVLIEKNFKSCAFIKSEFEKMNYKNAMIHRTNVFDFLKTNQIQFDVVFADPPFLDVDYKELHHMLFEKKILKEDGLLIIEHQKKIKLSELTYFTETKNYGNISFSFFKQAFKNDE
jgi:16S rRNA (guanine(966)-N(2))-methyltransferase RsmD